MKIEKPQIMGIIVFVVVLIGDFIFLFKGNKDLFYFVASIGCVIGALPFILLLITQSTKEEEKGEMFLEFSRDLVESVKSGTPISKSIINLKNKYYGTLTPYIQKLANQISIGIPVSQALDIFAKDVNSRIVTRAILLIKEAEKAGGNIEDILESVAKSVSEIEKLKKERRAAIYNLVIEGYIIFFVFILIMLIMQFKIIPMTEGIANIEGNIENLSINKAGGENLTLSMLMILLTQGFFAGLMIGKLAEGNVKSGLKHSFILIASSLLIFLGAKVFLK